MCFHKSRNKKWAHIVKQSIFWTVDGASFFVVWKLCFLFTGRPGWRFVKFCWTVRMLTFPQRTLPCGQIWLTLGLFYFIGVIRVYVVCLKSFKASQVSLFFFSDQLKTLKATKKLFLYVSQLLWSKFILLWIWRWLNYDLKKCLIGEKGNVRVLDVFIHRLCHLFQ